MKILAPLCRALIFARDKRIVQYRIGSQISSLCYVVFDVSTGFKHVWMC